MPGVRIRLVIALPPAPAADGVTRGQPTHRTIGRLLRLAFTKPAANDRRGQGRA